MLVAVVGELGGIGSHRNLVFLTVSAVGNGQRPLRCRDSVIIGVGTLGIAPRRNRAFAGSGHGLRAAVLWVGDALAVDERTRYNLPLGSLKRLAVVGLGGILGLNGHGAFVDDKFAVNCLNLELGGHIVARCILNDRGAVDLVLILARIGSRHACAEALNGESSTLVVGECSVGHARDGLFSSVIGLRRRIGGHRNLILVGLFTVGNGQLTFGPIDVVVVGLGALVQRVGERVVGGADEGLEARERIRRTLALSEARLGLERGSAVFERGAVVGLAQVGGLQGDLSLADYK